MLVSPLAYSLLFGSFMFHIFGRSTFSDNWLNFIFVFSQLITSVSWRLDFNCILLIDLFQIFLSCIILKNGQTSLENLYCEHYKICKVCLVIFRRYT